MSEYAGVAALRAGLMRDYNPASSRERLMIDEVAAAWGQLNQWRRHEQLFFELAAKKNSADRIMWLDKHAAYDRILRAIRDAEMAFDRAIRRIEQTVDRRLRLESRAPKPVATSPRAESNIIPFPHPPTSPGKRRRKSSRLYEPAIEFDLDRAG